MVINNISAKCVKCNMARMKRELYTLRFPVEAAERFKAWCGVMNCPFADGLGLLMDKCGIPSLESMREFVDKNYAPRSVRSPLEPYGDDEKDSN